PRIFIATLVLNRDVAAWIGRLTGAAFAVAVVIFVLSLRRSSADSKRLEGPKNPLQLWPALQMALTFQGVLFFVQYVQRGFGDAGLLVSGAVVGLTDVDALTLSMSRGASGGIEPLLAARAIAVGILANCGLKTAIAIGFGNNDFRRFT